MLQKISNRSSQLALHAAFIGFSQAYTTVPRLQLWDICKALSCLHHFSKRFRKCIRVMYQF
eukprot:1162072-Pelagomonas_calceolata.AAC.7